MKGPEVLQRLAGVFWIAAFLMMPACHETARPAPSIPPGEQRDSPAAARAAETNPREEVRPMEPAAAVAGGMRETFPGVRVDIEQRAVEFDATVPIDCHNERTPVVFLEVIACAPDTKEHEALALTRAKPSHIHAALLLIGLEPGKPGAWNWEGKQLTSMPPRGGRVNVYCVQQGADGSRRRTRMEDWVINMRDHRTLAEHAGQDGWVFSGSNIITRKGESWYQADREGLIIGLTSFSNETISWTKMYNPDSGVEEPTWIANAAEVPAYGTAFVVRVEAAP